MIRLPFNNLAYANPTAITLLEVYENVYGKFEFRVYVRDVTEPYTHWYDTKVEAETSLQNFLNDMETMAL